MEGFVKISPKELGNAMKMIGTEWMLITVKDEAQGRANAMTASWGCMGVLWNKSVCVCFIRPQRHTYGLVEAEDRISISFLPEKYRDALRICGTKSGRDTDKLAEAGLTSYDIDTRR
jgi:flavin reductase (DIM6/NTAB) family NADH-FMN oxidoreductase RutF